MKAVHLPDPERCTKFEGVHRMDHPLAPGEYFIAECPEGHFYLHFGCPCGQGHRSAIQLESAENPFSAENRVWKWDGVREPITVHPSIHMTGCSCQWHGWLQNGEWRVA